MRSAQPSPDTPVARALEEALGAVASETVRDAVMSRALREAGRTTVPERGAAVLEFAEGPLQHALASRLGDHVAQEVLDQVRPLLERAASRASRPDLSSAPSSLAARPGARDASRIDEEEASGVYDVVTRAVARPRTDPAPSGPLPLVFFASRDAYASASLARALGGRATVRVLEGLLDLLDALEEDRDAARVLILDGGYPAIQVPSLITVGPELVGRVRVVVWRTVEGDREAIQSAPSHSTQGWVRCPGHDVEALALLCTRTLA